MIVLSSDIMLIMASKQMQILRTDALDVRLGSDGQKHLLSHGVYADSDAPFELTVNNLTADIDLAQVITLHDAIDAYLHNLGYSSSELSIIRRYAVTPALRYA